MAEQIGIVIQTEPGGWARVLTDRKGACGGCHGGHGGGCRGCLTSAKFESRVTNPVGAKAGDIVRIALCSEALLKGVAIIYLLPVLALLIGAFAGTWIAGHMGWPASAGGVFGAFAGISAAAFLLIRVNRSKWARQRLTPTVLGVVSSEKPTHHSMSTGHAFCK